MQIENKIFLVSGGASGLGAATAQMLIAAGAKVMLVDLNADAVAAKARELGDNARSAVADISLAGCMGWSIAPAWCVAKKSSVRTAPTRWPASPR